MNQLIAAAGSADLWSRDWLTSHKYWFVLAISAGIVSAVGVVHETRTTSLLLSWWAAFLAGVLILLDIVVAVIVAKFLVKQLPTGWPDPLKYITVGGAAPTLLRSLKISVGKASIGPAYPYDVARTALLVRLDDEFGTRMEVKARLIAAKVIESHIPPQVLADVMKALVQRRKMTSEAKVKIGHILGALRAGSPEDQVERLVELMYQYQMRALIRDLETGRTNGTLVRSRPVYLVRPDGEVPLDSRRSS